MRARGVSRPATAPHELHGSARADRQQRRDCSRTLRPFDPRFSGELRPPCEKALPPSIQREDYAAPAYWIRSVELSFDLDPAKTIVGSRMRIERNPAVPAGPLQLHGEGLNLLRVLADGESVSFREEAGLLVIDNPPAADSFTLEIRNTCAPEKNTELSGLYTSGGGFFTQCEAEGFRRITYFLDRPDVMAVYTVTLRADKAKYPVLLSNGNLVEQGELDNGRHFAKWHDPFPKPSYLFALVAADLVAREQKIRTRAGRDHLLQVYVQARRPGQDRARDELADRLGGLGRGALRPAAGPGALHDRRGRATSTSARWRTRA